MAVKGVISDQLEHILDQYADRVNVTSDKIMKEVSEDTAADLRATSPGTKYAQSWAVKKQRHRYIVHNKDHYRLTHLLEYGHETYNQYGGPYNPAKAIPHIYRAEQKAITELFGKLNDAL